MPLKRCTSNGKAGWKWGKGKCFTGPGAKKKAAEQGAAIKSSRMTTLLEKIDAALSSTRT